MTRDGWSDQDAWRELCLCLARDWPESVWTRLGIADVETASMLQQWCVTEAEGLRPDSSETANEALRHNRSLTADDEAFLRRWASYLSGEDVAAFAFMTARYSLDPNQMQDLGIQELPAGGPTLEDSDDDEEPTTVTMVTLLNGAEAFEYRNVVRSHLTGAGAHDAVALLDQVASDLEMSVRPSEFLLAARRAD